MSKKFVYKDISLDFKPHPITGDITVLKDVDSVINSVKTLILTNHYERPMEPLKGANIRALHFENVTPATKRFLLKDIQSLLSLYEVRVDVLDVIVDLIPDRNSMDVTITMNVKDFRKEVTFSLQLQRFR